MDSVIQFEGTIYEKGYGLLPQKVMRDQELPKQSKLIYAYMCSFAGVGTNGERTAFPSVSLQCSELGMSEDTYYKWRKPLLEKGYIKITKQRSERSRFDRNIYSIVAVPQEKEIKETDNSPYPNFSGAGENPGMKGFYPYPNFSGTENSSTENKGTNSNRSNSISFNKEEEIINNAYADNVAYEILGDYLKTKKINQKTINNTILELMKRDLDLFLMEDVEKQFKHMMDKLKHGEVDNHNGFPVYFANGLQMRTTQSNASRQYQEEQIKEYELAMQKKRERAENLPYFDWLNA